MHRGFRTPASGEAHCGVDISNWASSADKPSASTAPPQQHRHTAAMHCMPTLHRSYTRYQCNSANRYGAGKRRTISSCTHCHGSRRQAGRAALVKRRGCGGHAALHIASHSARAALLPSALSCAGCTPALTCPSCTGPSAPELLLQTLQVADAPCSERREGPDGGLSGAAKA